MKIAAIGDLHVKESANGSYRDLFIEIGKNAEVLLLCGDLTDTGLPKEAENLAHDLSVLNIPVMGVLGNHDHHSDRVPEIKKILEEAKLIFLEDQTHEIGDVGFAGVKGFGGGYGEHMLSGFGEKAIKQFVEESVNETLKLENALQRLKTKYKVVALHYSPIPQTVHGEALEIYPYLGSSRLAETLERFDVQAVFHGHAHRGIFKGMMRKGTPVYNCSQPIVQKEEGRPYAVIEMPQPLDVLA